VPKPNGIGNSESDNFNPKKQPQNTPPLLQRQKLYEKMNASSTFDVLQSLPYPNGAKAKMSQRDFIMGGGEAIPQPNQHDVLLGRGGRSYKYHPGNMFFAGTYVRTLFTKSDAKEEVPVELTNCYGFLPSQTSWKKPRTNTVPPGPSTRKWVLLNPSFIASRREDVSFGKKRIQKPGSSYLIMRVVAKHLKPSSTVAVGQGT
jgi:hypothetical protein